VVREDLQQLYGFASRAERDLFRVLIRISGVGPKLALRLLSSLNPGELAARCATVMPMR
jgi:holliday junction DNA helicase RuvA